MHLHGQEITTEFLGPLRFAYEGVFPVMSESTSKLRQILTLLKNCLWQN